MRSVRALLGAVEPAVELNRYYYAKRGGAQCTCFTGTKVQILTPEELQREKRACCYFGQLRPLRISSGNTASKASSKASMLREHCCE